MCEAGWRDRDDAPQAMTAPGAAGAEGLIALEATPAGVRAAVAQALRRLGPHLPQATLEPLEIVLSEVLNYVVEHAYEGAGGRIENLHIAVNEIPAEVLLA